MDVLFLATAVMDGRDDPAILLSELLVFLQYQREESSRLEKEIQQQKITLRRLISSGNRISPPR